MAGKVALLVVLAVLVATASSSATGSPSEDPFTLPEGLLIGAGVSALQTEGAWNTHGKGESQADHLFHMESMKDDFPANPDVAANTYERFREDVAMAKKLKVSLTVAQKSLYYPENEGKILSVLGGHFESCSGELLQLYRLSFSWSRLLPKGDVNEPNKEGVDFYKAYIKEIIDNGILPFVTLNHFDHPQILQEQLLGWENKTMSDKFAEYAGFVFATFGDDVKLWNTMNEPNFYCLYFSYMLQKSGSIKKTDQDWRRCMHNSILAHMKAYRIYQSEFAYQRGKVGSTSLFIHGQPSSTKPEDVYAAELWNEIHFGQLVHPIVYGDYSDLLKKALGTKLPLFSDEEKEQLKNCTDFIGVNVYNGHNVYYTSDPKPAPMSPYLAVALEDFPFIHLDTVANMDFTKINPEVLKRGTLWTWQRYGKPIIIAENGFGGNSSTGIHDHTRVVYHSAFLRELVSTIKTFKMDVLAYTAWSLIDCFEWTAGYSRVFGLVHVDYEHGSLNRTLKDSSSFFIEVADTRIVPDVPDNGSSPLKLLPTAILAPLMSLWLTT